MANIEMVYFSDIDRFIATPVYNSTGDTRDNYFVENAFCIIGSGVYNVAWAFIGFIWCWVVLVEPSVRPWERIHL